MPEHDENPPFFGYFAPSIDGGLLSLLRVSTPGNPERERMSEGALAEQRFMALEVLEKQDLDLGHARAARVVARAVGAGAPFGLYLRNFDLVGRTEPGAVDPWGEPQVITLMHSTDVRLQRLVAEQAERVPFVAIENRAADAGPFPRFICADEDWELCAELLIRHAAVVVMLYLGLTPGVALELDLLRQAGAQSRTLIVVGGEPVTTTWLATLARAMGRRPLDDERPAPPADPPPADFPHVLTLREDEAARDTVAALLAAAQAPRPTVAAEDLLFPPPLRPPQPALDLAHGLALEEFGQAAKHVDAGELVPAEDALMRSIAFSHWARDRLGRLMAYVHLAAVERQLHYPNDAVATFFLALDLAEALAPISETAAELRPALAEGLAAYLDELGDAPRAATVRARAVNYAGPNLAR